MKVIELPDEQAEALTALAEAEGLSLAAWLQRLAAGHHQAAPDNPSGSLRGLLKEYGRAPSEAEIDQNRREMFSNFAGED